jgi:hypothetical protein
MCQFTPAALPSPSMASQTSPGGMPPWVSDEQQPSRAGGAEAGTPRAWVHSQASTTCRANLCKAACVPCLRALPACPACVPCLRALPACPACVQGCLRARLPACKAACVQGCLRALPACPACVPCLRALPACKAACVPWWIQRCTAGDARAGWLQHSQHVRGAAAAAVATGGCPRYSATCSHSEHLPVCRPPREPHGHDDLGGQALAAADAPLLEPH